MTADFCPLVRGKCHGDRCMAWRDGDCLLVIRLEQSVADWRRRDANAASESEEPEVPEALRAESAEDLAGQLVAYAKRTFPNYEVSMWQARNDFWQTMGIDVRRSLSDPISSKMDRVSHLAEQMVDTEITQRDAAALPQLIIRCVEWARGRGLKRITLSDVGVFLLRDGAKLGREANRTLYATVNLELKTMTGQ